MLHSLPALLEELEHMLLQGGDPRPLLEGIRWADVIDWPRTRDEADRIKSKLGGIQFLVSGLEAPLRATLMRLNQPATYRAKGAHALPKVVSFRFGQSV